MRQAFKRARTEAQKDERRRLILNAAQDLMAEVGLENVRVSAVAKRAGIAKGTVYLYYQSREEMFVDLYEEAYADWLIAIARAPELQDKPSKEEFARAAAKLIERHAAFRFLHGAFRHSLWDKLSAGQQAKAVDILAPGRSALADLIATLFGFSASGATAQADSLLLLMAGFEAQAPFIGTADLAKMITAQLRTD